MLITSLTPLNMDEKILNLLRGKKTYLLAATVALVVFLELAGLVDPALAMQLKVLLGAGGAAALRAGINKAQ